MPHIDHLYRLAYRFCNNQHDAEDLVQELLVKLYPKLKELKQIENLRPWLARSLYHHFIDSVRRFQNDPLRDAPDLADFENILESAGSTEDSTDNQYIQQQLIDSLKKLSPDHRTIIKLHDIEGYSLNELMEILELPLGTLKSRLHRARQQLRNSLTNISYDLEPFCAEERVNR